MEPEVEPLVPRRELATSQSGLRKWTGREAGGLFGAGTLLGAVVFVALAHAGAVGGGGSQSAGSPDTEPSTRVLRSWRGPKEKKGSSVSWGSGGSERKFAFVQMAIGAPSDSPPEQIWSALAAARAVQRLSVYPFVLLTNLTVMPGGAPVVETFEAVGARVLPLHEVLLPAKLQRSRDARALRLALWKLHIWRLKQFQRVIWLDVGAVLFRSLDWLFEQTPVWGEQGRAGCSDSWDASVLSEGMLYIEPSDKDFEGLLSVAADQPPEQLLSSGVPWLARTYFMGEGNPVRMASRVDVTSDRCLGSAPALPRHRWRSMPAVIFQSSEGSECFALNRTRQLRTVRDQVVNVCHRHPLASHWRDLVCDAIRTAKITPEGAEEYCDDMRWYGGTGREPLEPPLGSGRTTIVWATPSTSLTTTTLTITETTYLNGVCNTESEAWVPGPAPSFDVTDEENDHCFSLVEAAVPDLAKGGKGGRNWCWVGFKASGCHSHMFEHLGWMAEHTMAIEAGFTIDRPFDPLAKPHLCDRPELGAVPEWSAEELEEAKEWFRNTVSVFVLSLPSSRKRRTAVAKQLDLLGVNHTVVWGVDLRKRGALEDARQEGLVPEHFSLAAAQQSASLPENNMEGDGSIAGTVGCAAGHFRAQRRAAESASRFPMAVIFEDDVKPSNDFVPRLWQLVTKELPCDWQVVSLASRCPFGTCVAPHLSRVQPDVNEPAERCHHGVNYGFQGVLYRAAEIYSVQSLWQPVVFDSTRPHCLDVDVALASISDRVAFYAVPASQTPGMLEEMWELGSTRISINKERSVGRI